MLTIGEFLSGLCLMAIFAFLCFVYGSLEHVLQHRCATSNREFDSGSILCCSCIKKFFTPRTNSYLACLTPLFLSILGSTYIAFKECDLEHRFLVLCVGLLLCTVSALFAKQYILNLSPVFVINCGVIGILNCVFLFLFSYMKEDFRILAMGYLGIHLLLIASQFQLLCNFCNREFRSTYNVHIFWSFKMLYFFNVCEIVHCLSQLLLFWITYWIIHIFRERIKRVHLFIFNKQFRMSLLFILILCLKNRWFFESYEHCSRKYETFDNWESNRKNYNSFNAFFKMVLKFSEIINFI